jgi:hypothetical protein
MGMDPLFTKERNLSSVKFVAQIALKMNKKKVFLQETKDSSRRKEMNQM